MPGPRPGARATPLSLLLTQETAEERVCRAYEAERDTVYRYLVSLGIGRADAQELTQEVFLRMYRAIHTGTEIHTLRAWLFTVASRVALNFLRDEERRPLASAVDDETLLDTIVAQDLSPEIALLRREQLEELRHVIRQLPQDQQVCLHLRAEGFRYQAIADIAGLSVPAVAGHLRRALARLRKVIHG